MPNDTELESLFSIVQSLKNDYVKEGSLDIWKDSPFAWIKTRPSRQVGKIGEQIVAEWCKQKGFVVSKSGNSGADLVVNGHPIEIKFSTLWETNHYQYFTKRACNFAFYSIA